MEEKKKKRGFLAGLLGRRAAEEPEEIKEELPPEPEEPEEKEPETDPGAFPPMSGSLLKVWERWTEEMDPPLLSLTDGNEAVSELLDASTLMQERVRLSVRMEQDARGRLKTLDQAAEREGPKPDALCKVYISRNALVAWMFIFPPAVGGEEVALDAIGRAMQEAGVTTGLDSTAVMELFQKKAYYRLVPVAFGTPVTEGADGFVTELFEHEQEKQVQLDENGNADYRALNYVRMIEEGTPICEITLPREGVAGVRVDGKVIKPKTVRRAKVPAGSNTAVTEDGLTLIATQPGNLEYANGSFHVRPILEIHGDVDYSVGNIDFRGDVHVHGDVRENFTIQATGSVMVDGLVEASTIDAGGDLVVSCGILGDNRALIKCQGTIRVKYLENCVVYAGKKVYADCIISSQIFSDDTIEVMTGRGTIIGGTLTAAHSVRARVIGSQAGRKTDITLGVLSYIQEELEACETDLKVIHREMEDLVKWIAHMEEKQQQNGLEGTDEKLAKAYLRRSVLSMKEAAANKRMAKLAPMIPDLSRCRLECGTVYPITTLTIQDQLWHAEGVCRNLRAGFSVKTGELKIY